MGVMYARVRMHARPLANMNHDCDPVVVLLALVELSRDSDEEDDKAEADVRKPLRVMDKHITCDEELSDSDDESGARRDHQSHKVRIIMRFRVALQGERTPCGVQNGCLPWWSRACDPKQGGTARQAKQCLDRLARMRGGPCVMFK